MQNFITLGQYDVILTNALSTPVVRILFMNKTSVKNLQYYELKFVCTNQVFSAK